MNLEEMHSLWVVHIKYSWRSLFLTNIVDTNKVKLCNILLIYLKLKNVILLPIKIKVNRYLYVLKITIYWYISKINISYKKNGPVVGVIRSGSTSLIRNDNLGGYIVFEKKLL